MTYLPLGDMKGRLESHPTESNDLDVLELEVLVGDDVR